MNASVYTSPYGFYVKYYLGDKVVDEAGPFEDAVEAEESAHRWADAVNTDHAGVL